MAANEKLVLLVDDEVGLLDAIASRLELLGFTPLKATHGLEALEIAGKQPVDIAIVDLQMPDMNGLVTITKLKEIRPNIKTILLTGHGNEKVKQATESLNTSYFEKEDMENFWRFIRQLDADGRLMVIRPPAAAPMEAHARRGFSTNEIEPLPDSSFDTSPQNRSGASKLTRIIGETPPLRELRKNIEWAAAMDCTVIISGEKGTGKELAARMIHGMSARKDRRLFPVDCSRFTNLAQMEQLLGTKGTHLLEAFRDHHGIFGMGAGGTLFLDRVEALPMELQKQLLDMLVEINDGAFDGTIDIRIISAAREDLNRKVKEGAFLEDLYWQLNLFSLHIPPLRERKDDIPPLCSFFLDAYKKEFQKRVEAFSEEVMSAFRRYDFPGNVRELEYIVERAVLLSDGKIITMSHLPERFQKTAPDRPSESPVSFQTLAEKEVAYIAEVLAATNGNKSKTAEILGISRAALWRKLKQMKAAGEKS